MKNNNEKMVMALLAGAVIGTAIGTGVGILFAPRKGSKTRRRLRHSVEGSTHDVSKWLKHSRDELTKTAYDNKKAFNRKLEDALSTMSHKAEDIIKALEDKLEDVKKKNAELQK